MHSFLRAFVLAPLLLSLPALAAPSLRVGLVIDRDGRKDRGFNAAGIQGLERAKKAFKATAEIAEAEGDQGHEPLLRGFAKQGFDLVIALGAPRAAAVAKVAKEFPRTRFAIVDGEVKAPNVRSILFKEQEGAFLAGAIAAGVSQTGKLGCIGGMDIPVVRRYQEGFAAGARRISPKAKVSNTFIGKDGSAWRDRGAARALAEQQYDSGVDVILAVGGEANLGVFDAAEAKSKLAIGVSDQNALKPGFVLTSVRKRIDVGVLMACQDAMLGGFTAETKHYGLAESAVDLVIDDNSRKLIPAALLQKVEKLRDAIAEGK